MNESLQSNKVWCRVCSAVTGYGIMLLDADGTIIALNDGVKALTLYGAPEAIGKHFSVFETLSSRTVAHADRELEMAAAIGRYEAEGWRARNDGTTFWAHIIITPVYDEANVLCGFVKVLRDATAQKQMADQYRNTMTLLEQTALTDYLTGLDNRRSLDRILSATLARARRHGAEVCLAMFDIDRFKEFNDNRGHQAGDAFLRKAARRWRAAVRSEDLVARYGGEEFVVLMPDTAQAGAVECMERLRGATPAPMTCSAGLAMWDGAETPEALIGRADQALYKAKAGGRDCLIVAQGRAPEPSSTPAA
jgi:diguanylate cyclase (GGDEF)-like protein/PAS domain S-box-containing protein